MGLRSTLRDWFTAPSPERSISTVDDYMAAMNEYFWFNGNSYPLGGLQVQQTLAGEKAERITNNLEGYATSAYAGNSIVFSCMAVRQLVFSAVRFQFQRVNKGRPSELFGMPSLRPLEIPWPGGNTQDLLSRVIQDVDLTGNSYWTLLDGELVRLRPDWVDIVLRPVVLGGATIGYRRVGYVYTEGGSQSGQESAVMLADEVAHIAPYPDPLATYRGMSWLTPVIREIQNDGLMTIHKRKFFENGATPNMVVKGVEAKTSKEFIEKVEMMEGAHSGVANAYKTLYLTPGADVSVVGVDLQQMDFKVVQGAGETRVAAAAGVPPVIVGLSEGLQGSSLNAGNYGQARRRFADGTMHPLWQNVAGSFQHLIRPPSEGSTRLWYDARDVPFLREDRDAAATIQMSQASTMRQLIDAAFKPESVVAAVDAEDWGLLEHTGIMTVQVQSVEDPQNAGAKSANQQQAKKEAQADAEVDGGSD